MYDLLAGSSRVRRHHSLDVAQVLEREPSLRTDGLTGGVSYFDAATDDAGLTRANVASAAEHGAVAVSRAKAESMTSGGGKADGAIVRATIEGNSARVSARVIVSATGPWQAKGTKGSHIVVDRARVGNHGAVTIASPEDGRVMFVLPSGDRTVVGTTDIRTDETPDNVKASDAEVAYLLRAANAYFPNARLLSSDVIETWAGIRPLATAPAGTSPSSISREHRISRDRAGVIVVTGGKLTTYRSMAAEVVDEVERALGRKVVRSATDEEPLPHG